MNDLFFMQAALEEAKKAYELGEVPVGAVLVHNNKIIARSGNQTESLKCATKHAEMIVIEAASKIIGDWRLNQLEMFVTLEPCPMCAGAIRLARIKKVIIAAADQRNGAFHSSINLTDQPELGPIPEIKIGVLNDQSSQMLKNFFKELRT